MREGIQGLFAGITLRLIGEVLVVVISGPLATAINLSNQFVEPRWIRRFVSFSFRVKFSFTLSFLFGYVKLPNFVIFAKKAGFLPCTLGEWG